MIACRFRIARPARIAALSLALLASTPLLAADSPAPKLPALSATGSLTVSGLSSGAFMAVQFHVAHSARVSGAGVMAGGPYYCALANAMLAISSCMSPNLWTPTPSLDRLQREVETQAAAKRIDPPEHLASARVWLFSGGKDSTVTTEVVDSTYAFYQHWLPPAQILYERLPDAGHAVVNPVTKKPGECSTTASPYLDRCGNFDAPGRLLAYLLGALKAPVAAAGELLAFDQNEFAPPAARLANTGYVYVPVGCRAGGCRVHVAFHGCRQFAETIGETFVREAGYNRWAEANRLIVLYPQTKASGSAFDPDGNPNGCWDWWGYTGADYHVQDAPQIKAVMGMVERLQDK